MNKKYVFLGVVVAVIVGGVVIMDQVVQPLLDSRTVETVVSAQIKVPEYDFAFSYPSGVAGYVLVEPPVATTSESLKKAYLMFEYGQYLDYRSAEANAQTPPAVSVFVFALPGKAEGSTLGRSERLMQWIEENPQYTSFNRRNSEVEEVEVDGVSAVSYSTEGIYFQDFTIASYSGNAYIFAGQYEVAGDSNVLMFTDLINSVTFY